MFTLLSTYQNLSIEFLYSRKRKEKEKSKDKRPSKAVILGMCIHLQVNVLYRLVQMNRSLFFISRTQGA